MSARLSRVSAPRAHDAADLEIFLDRHLLEDPAALRDKRDAGARRKMRRLAGEVATVEQDAAGGRLHQPHDRLDGRTFSRAVGAEQRDDLALLDREAHAVQHLDLAVGDAQVINREPHRRLRR